jgi:GTPase
VPINVAIVGRPNAGKSTLFNRLAGRRLAIVDEAPGATRDRAFAGIDLGGLELTLIDTAGFEEGPPESMQARMTAQTKLAIRDADICLFLVDARSGMTTGDEIVAEALRRSGKPVVLAANKCEKSTDENAAGEFFALGFGEPVCISALHGIGFGELQDALMGAPGIAPPTEEQGEVEEDPQAPRPLRFAIVGRPNAGKSSLLNRLIGEERSLTSPEAGTTRDAVAAEWRWEGRDILIHDTAGLRKKARVEERLEKLSVESALTAVRFADCVVLVMDARDAFEKQDLTIADLIAREGRAIVFVVNKWDKVEDRKHAIASLREKADRFLPQVKGAPIVAVSALTGEGMERLMPAVMEADRIWNARASTSAINRFLAAAIARNPPPAVSGRRIQIRYMTQVKSRPPTFVLFGNQLDALPESYLRYLTNGIRGAFGMPGTPIRISARTAKNPFADKERKVKPSRRRA